MMSELSVAQGCSCCKAVGALVYAEPPSVLQSKSSLFDMLLCSDLILSILWKCSQRAAEVIVFLMFLSLSNIMLIDIQFEIRYVGQQMLCTKWESSHMSFGQGAKSKNLTKKIRFVLQLRKKGHKGSMTVQVQLCFTSERSVMLMGMPRSITIWQTKHWKINQWKSARQF